MVTINTAGDCSNPITAGLEGASTNRLGPLELLVYRKDKRWRWLVALDGEVLVEGRARGQEAAMRACEAAAYGCYLWALTQQP